MSDKGNKPIALTGSTMTGPEYAKYLLRIAGAKGEYFQRLEAENSRLFAESHRLRHPPVSDQ